MFNYKLAVDTASRAGVNPVRYTTKEAGEWITLEPFVTPEHIHSIEFSNGQRWDERTGWNFHSATSSSVMRTNAMLASQRCY